MAKLWNNFDVFFKVANFRKLLFANLRKIVLNMRKSSVNLWYFSYIQSNARNLTIKFIKTSIVDTNNKKCCILHKIRKHATMQSMQQVTTPHLIQFLFESYSVLFRSYSSLFSLIHSYSVLIRILFSSHSDLIQSYSGLIQSYSVSFWLIPLLFSAIWIQSVIFRSIQHHSVIFRIIQCNSSFELIWFRRFAPTKWVRNPNCTEEFWISLNNAECLWIRLIESK